MSKKNTAEVGVQYDRAWSPIAVWNGYEKGDLVHVTGTAGCEFRFAYAHERFVIFGFGLDALAPAVVGIRDEMAILAQGRVALERLKRYSPGLGAVLNE